MNTLEEAKKHLSEEAFYNVEFWIQHFLEFKNEIEKLIHNEQWEEMEDAFFTRIEVGTGGLRGKIGVGPNRINMRTIGEAAQGLSDFIKDFGAEAMEKGVVVGHEVRTCSREFARLSCQVFAANGISSYLFDGIRATPEVSFAVRHLGVTAGVQITASHNPRTDNGFKFYWTDGGQVVAPLDVRFMELVRNVKDVAIMDFEKAEAGGFISTVGKKIDDAYIRAVGELSLVKNRSADITFSPLHAAGSTNVLPVLLAAGFHVDIVKEQEKPDGSFPTAVSDVINPEYKEVMALCVSRAQEHHADVAIASDPDADRMGVGVKKHLDSAELELLSGNEVGALLCKFILLQLQKRETLSPSNLVITTYVTTSLISDIAKSFHVEVADDLLVGFKYIGQIIEGLAHKDDFVFAAEESLGYLRGTFVRDKDAAIASLLFCEMASWLKDQNKSVVEYLDDIYEEYGYYKNILHTARMKGKEGFLAKKSIMQGLRANPPQELAGRKVIKIIDRLPEEKRKPENYKVGATGDQLTFVLSEDERTRITVRPSGTEPILKYYIQHYKKSEGNLDATKQEVDAIAQEMKEAIAGYERS